MPPPTRTRHRRCALLLVGAALLGSCGDDDGRGAAGPATTATDAPIDVTSAVPAEPQPPPSDSTTPEPSCVQIVHETGSTCAPRSPERIVVVDPVGALPTLLAAGAPVVGATTPFDPDDPWPAYFDGTAISDVEVVGSVSAPNFEAIAALEPELIFVTPDVSGAELLAEIAPTVAFATFYTDDWIGATTAIASAAGASEAYEEVLDRVVARTAELADQFAAVGDTITITHVDDYGGAHFVYDHRCLWYGQLFAELGLSQPAGQRNGCEPSDPFSVVMPVSAERFDLLDGDAIFVYAAGAPAGTEIPNTPSGAALWGGLDAVRAGQAYAVGDAWGLGGNVWAADRVLDDLGDLADRLLSDQP